MDLCIGMCTQCTSKFYIVFDTLYLEVCGDLDRWIDVQQVGTVRGETDHARTVTGHSTLTNTVLVCQSSFSITIHGIK